MTLTRREWDAVWQKQDAWYQTDGYQRTQSYSDMKTPVRRHVERLVNAALRRKAKAK